MSDADSVRCGVRACPDHEALSALLAAQSRRLAPLRDRLLRRVSPGLRGPTLDLACGSGSLSAELASRVRGPVVALDRDPAALARVMPPALRVTADATALPLRDGAFDLVVSQLAWLWFGDIDAVALEVRRVLAPGGVLVALGEPDFGGAIEHPAELALASAWESALRRAGADPWVGRVLPGALRRAGFSRVEAEVFGPLTPPGDLPRVRAEEAALLRTLGLTAAEEARVAGSLEAASRTSADALAFVPTFGVVAWI